MTRAKDNAVVDILREIAKVLRGKGYESWTAGDVADWLEIEAERREHPEKFKPEFRLP